MLSTLLVIVGVLVGLFVLLAAIVRLSAPPTTAGPRTGARTGNWSADPTTGTPVPTAR